MHTHRHMHIFAPTHPRKHAHTRARAYCCLYPVAESFHSHACARGWIEGGRGWGFEGGVGLRIKVLGVRF